MEPGDIIIFIINLGVSGLLVALGIPLIMGLVRPNPLYGFRTQNTLQDPDVWYATNRVAGFWATATGIVTAGVSLWTFFARLGLPTLAWVNLAPLMVGISGALLHGFLVVRRVTRDKQKGKTD